MGVYDTATKLASEIKSSKEYKHFKNSMSEVKKDKNAEALLKDYRIIQMEIQKQTMRNLPIDKKLQRKIESIQKKANSNKKVNNYLTSEREITILMDNINKILGKAIEEDYK